MKVQIKTKGGIYHKGIQDELETIRLDVLNKRASDFLGTVTILENSNLIHFKYKTDIQYPPARPLIPAPNSKPVLTPQTQSTPRPLPQTGQPSIQVEPSILVRNKTTKNIYVLLNQNNNASQTIAANTEAPICQGKDCLEIFDCVLKQDNKLVKTPYISISGFAKKVAANKKTRGIIVIEERNGVPQKTQEIMQ